jgi:maltoporin
MTFHHLIPKKMHRRTYFRKNYTKLELNQGIDICRKCHTGIHKRYDEMTLAKQFATLENLSSDPDLQQHFAWVAKQKEQHD